MAERLAAAGGVKPSLVDAYRALLTGQLGPCPRVHLASSIKPPYARDTAAAAATRAGCPALNPTDECLWMTSLGPVDDITWP